MSSSLLRRVRVGALLCLLVLAPGCDRLAAPDGAGAAAPAQAVRQLVDDLRKGELDAYARHAVPPDLHARLATAWSQGHTLWPLTELPLDAKFQDFITALAAPGSEQRLLATYRLQFAGERIELRTAAATLGLFATRYVGQEAAYSDVERDHYVQLIAALTRWGQRAPLADLAHARKAIPQLALAARSTGLAGADGLRKAGMDASLERLGPFVQRLGQVADDYGLGLKASLAGLQVRLDQQTGDHARVRLQYAMAGQPIDAIVLVERRGGRWYLTDLLRRAEVEAGAGTLTATAEPSTGGKPAPAAMHP
ncbi:hypothetical protein [Lysobacter fragariae]